MIPLLCVTTSASVHDSQTAIPMMKRLSAVVTSLYDLMDSAYDAPAIKAVSVSLGHVPIIDQNRRRGPKLKLAPCEAVRYGERSNAQQRAATRSNAEQRAATRSNAERGNRRLKDSFGLRFVRVRGHAKVHLHTMLGVLALFADQLLKPHPGEPHF